jgi:hypothetical protein
MLERRRSRLPRNPARATPEISALGILERLPVPTVAVTDDGAVLFANTAFAGALGCSRDAVLSMTYDDVVHVLPPEDSLVAVARFGADTIVKLRHLAGTTLYAKVGKSVTRGGDDAVVLATFAMLTDLRPIPLLQEGGRLMSVACLSQDLYGFAIELRQLAYTVPGGHEDPFVRLSERMVRHARQQAPVGEPPRPWSLDTAS